MTRRPADGKVFHYDLHAEASCAEARAPDLQSGATKFDSPERNGVCF